jgi:hypothetical protein
MRERSILAPLHLPVQLQMNYKTSIFFYQNPEKITYFIALSTKSYKLME